MMERTAIRDGGLLLFDAAFLSPGESAKLFQHLIEAVPWKQESGRFGPMPRLTAWYADDGLTYSYSGVTHVGLEWTAELRALKEKLEAVCETQFNSALLNRYRDSRDSMGWHADDEKELGTNPAIASVSLGAARRFLLRHVKTKETIEHALGDGSLLVMAGATQHHWRHSIPKTAQAVGERVNLTFRKIISA